MHQHQIRVYTEDVDFMGIVYHANYIKYFERSRTELLRQHHLLLTDLRELDILFAINEIEIKYKLPAKMDDLLTITTEIKEVKSCSFLFEQHMRNQMEQHICHAKIQVVCINNRLKPKRLPEFLSVAYPDHRG